MATGRTHSGMWAALQSQMAACQGPLPLADHELGSPLPVVTRTKVHELRAFKPQSSSLSVLKTENQLEMKVDWAGLLR